MSDIYIKQEFKRIFKMVCRWKGCQILSWHIGDEHIHLHLTIPPKYSVAYIVNVVKGKSSSWIKKKTKKFPKGTLWSQGYFVSTIGINEFAIRKYIENQNYYKKDLPPCFNRKNPQGRRLACMIETTSVELVVDHLPKKRFLNGMKTKISHADRKVFGHLFPLKTGVF